MANSSIYDAFERLWQHSNNKFVDKNNLGSAAYTEITDYDARGKADAALASAKTYADGKADAALASAKTYADEIKNNLLNGAGAAYDTLKELGELIDENQDTIETLENIANGKADAIHIHAISEISGLQDVLDNNKNELGLFQSVATNSDFVDENKNYVLPDGTVYHKQYTTSYTNQLKTALNRYNLNEILVGNNTIGYVENARLSTSQNKYVTANHWDTTGLIPCGPHDIIRFKNVTFQLYEGDLNDNRGEFRLYTQDGTAISSASLHAMTTSSPYIVELDENNNILKFDVPNWLLNDTLPVGYISFTCQDINQDSIITVNEEITDDFEYKFVPANYKFINHAELTNLTTEINHLNSDVNKINNQIDNLIINDNSIPDYWIDSLKSGAKKINNALLEAGFNKSAFLFYSDAHWTYNNKMSPTLLKYLYKHTGMNKTFFSGDIVDNESNDYDTMAYLWDWRNRLKDLPNHHSAPGNHDDGNAVNNRFSTDYVYGFLRAAEETPDIVRGNEGLYYYIDNPSEKTRYLFLDTAFLGLTNEQKTFIHDALLNTPEKWHIVAIAHIWHDTDYSASPPVPKELSVAGRYLLELFDSYNLRTGDFTEAKGKVEFCVGGHTHWDYSSKSATGIPVILVETDSKHVRSGLPCNAGTVTESAVSGIIANYKTNQIHVIRIGRGSDRIINIGLKEDEPDIPSYTNVLRTAVDVDGVTLYNNGKGYQANKRISGSSCSIKDNPGSYATGFIPVPAGTFTMRFKNITLNSSANYGGSFYCFCGLGTEAADTISYDSTYLHYYDPLYDDNGNIIQMTFGNTKGYTHVAFSASYINDTSIVTINEPIIDNDTNVNNNINNMLPLATDIDGNIYNTTGFKTGMRINSELKEITDSNYTLTGFIPYKYDETLYLSAEIFDNNPGSANIACYDNNKTIFKNVYVNIQDIGVITKDKNSNYIFRVNQIDSGASIFQNVAFIRVSGLNINTNSIITINQPIDGTVIPKLKNLIPTAVDIDGTTLYNGGLGYKPNVRMSTSTGTISSNTGSYCTGYIPLPVLNNQRRYAVRLKNIVNNNANNYGCNFALFQELNTAPTDTVTLSSEYFVSQYHPKFDENGNVIYIDIDIPNGYKYFTHSASYMDENSEITIDGIYE